MRYWSLLFAASFAFSVGCFVYAPFDPNWWLPGFASTNGRSLERLDSARDEIAQVARDEEALLAATRRKGDDPELARGQAAIQERLTLGRALSAEEAKAAGAERALPALRILDDLAGRKFLLPYTDEAAAALRDARDQMGLARQALGSGDPAAATRAEQEALARLDAARARLAAASEDVGRTVSRAGREVDHLYILILWITGIAFIGTMVAIILAIYWFASAPGRRAQYFHGSQRLEVVWTIIPAAILVFIALYQMGTWSGIKFRSAMPKVQPAAQVTARQFQWMIRYPGPDGRLNTEDDVHTFNDLRFVKGTDVVILLKTEDVLHSFFMPQLRIKQDAVPGLTIPVWFDADKAGEYDLVCAELCGWGHTRMKGKVTVYNSQEEFDDWMRNQRKAQDFDGYVASAGPEGEGK